MNDLSLKREKKSFLDVFPTPKYLFLATSGISLSGTGVQYIEFKPHPISRDLTLQHRTEIPLPEGALEAGYIKNDEAVISALKKLKDTHHLKYVKATLPEEKAYLFTTHINKKPFNSLRDRIAFIIEENVPVSLKESVFDFEIIGNTKHEAVIKVAVSVLPTSVVEGYMNIFEQAGLVPVSFEVESQAIARAVIPRGDDRPHLILNLDIDKTGLYIAENEIVQFSSTVLYGARKEDSGYPDLAHLKLEIRKLFGFWNTRVDAEGIPQKMIQKVFIAGKCAIDGEFVAQLMDDFNIEYTVANVWVNALAGDPHLFGVSLSESLLYGAAIGVALPDNEPRYV